MKRISTVKPIVNYLLYTNEATRGSDRVLACEFYKYIGVDITRPFNEIMMDADLPPFESIRRNRALLQSENPELRPSAEVTRWRKEQEEAVRGFLKDGRV